MVRELPNLGCPKCESATAVRDSRPGPNKNIIRRRRVCLECRHRFTTYELAAIHGLTPEGMNDLLGAAFRALKEAEAQIGLSIAGARENLESVAKAHKIMSGLS